MLKNDRWLNAVPLRWVLIVPFVAQILVIVGLAGFLSHRSSEKAVEVLSGHLIAETEENIKHYLESYLQSAQKLNQANKELLESEVMNPQDFQRLGKLFWLQVQKYDFVYVNYGTAQREFIGSGYVDNQLDIAEVRLPNLNQIHVYKKFSPLGDRLPPPIISEQTNPNDADWYWSAIKAGKPTWSSIYNWAGVPNEISISASAPVYNASKQLIGVVGVDLSLANISKFLRGLTIGETGRVFIVDHEGLLIASSTGQNPYEIVNGKAQRIKLSALSDPLAKSINDVVIKEIGGWGKTHQTIDETPKPLFYSDNFIGFQHYQDPYGLDWLILIAIPQSDYMTEIRNNDYRILVLSGITFVVSTALGIIIANWVTRPVKGLIQSSQLLAEENWQKPMLANSPIWEIQQLSHFFNQMATKIQWSSKQLQTTLETLDRRNQELQQFLDSIPLGIRIIDRHGQVSYANQRAIALTGQEPDFVCHPDDYLCIYQAYLAGTDQLYPRDKSPLLCALKGESRQVDDIEIHRGDQIIALEAWGTPIYNAQGEVEYAIVAFQDIGDRKLAAAQLQQSNEELLRANQLKDEFLANMSHELRTPLNSILGMTEALIEQIYGTVNDQQLKSLQTVEKSGFHLLNLINDILDLAKIGAGQAEIECYPTEVIPLCNSSLIFIQQQALQKRIQIHTEFPPHSPILFIDERRISQVLINLLNNAIKFTADGGNVTLTVREVESPSEQKMLRFSVRDTGIGIAADDLPKLFQSFVQLDGGLNRHYEGTGLGLALVKQIVELHGGLVGVTSEVGKGSCFTVDLPWDGKVGALNLALTANGTQSELGAEKNLSPALRSPLILLAEDNEANILSIGAYLEAKNYRVIVAKNGEAAIALAQSEKPDIILMDIQMPIMDGWEAIRKISLNPELATIPIIVLTALIMENDRENCLALGASDYLVKPVKMAELVKKIESYLALNACST